MKLKINLHNFQMTAETFTSPLSNGIRIQSDSDKWRNHPKSTKRTSIKSSTKNYNWENQMHKYQAKNN